MKKNSIVERLRRSLSGLKLDMSNAAELEPSYISKRDAAVLKVAMMVAALDGAVTEAELTAFEAQAKKCPGYSAQSAKDLFRDGLRVAGYLELAARTLSARELQGIFIDEAKKILSDGFVQGDAIGIRSAFVTWMVMAMADGEYSANERKAIGALATCIKEIIDKRRDANYRRQSLSPAFAAAYREQCPEGCVLTPLFFAKAETLIVKLNHESTAAAELKKLIVDG